MTLIVSLKTPLFNHLHQAAQTQASGDTAQKNFGRKTKQRARRQIIKQNITEPHAQTTKIGEGEM
ncbi:MAG: hypothetical protein SPD56_00560 [Alloprevotella sp.]|nr:hypothetical protein [Alloprevotella sp.]